MFKNTNLNGKVNIKQYLTELTLSTDDDYDIGKHQKLEKNCRHCTKL